MGIADRIDKFLDRSKGTMLAALAFIAAASAGGISSQEGGPRWLSALGMAVAIAATVAYRHHVRAAAYADGYDAGTVQALADAGVLHDVMAGAGTPLEPGGEREYLESLTTEGKS